MIDRVIQEVIPERVQILRQDLKVVDIIEDYRKIPSPRYCYQHYHCYHKDDPSDILREVLAMVDHVFVGEQN